jgi:hypothetical protein
MTTLSVRAIVARVPAFEAHLPIVASGAVAFIGQMHFARLVLGWPFLGQVLYASAVELFGYGMARLSARVRREGERAAAAIAAAVLFATYAGACNYWHASPSWSPTPTSVSLGVASVAGLAAFYVHEHYAVARVRRTVATDPAFVDVPLLAVVPAVTEADAPSRDDATQFDATDGGLSPHRRRTDGPTKTDLARSYLQTQKEAGRLDAVDGPELVRETGVSASYARQLIQRFRAQHSERNAA